VASPTRALTSAATTRPTRWGHLQIAANPGQNALDHSPWPEGVVLCRHLHARPACRGSPITRFKFGDPLQDLVAAATRESVIRASIARPNSRRVQPMERRYSARPTRRARPRRPTRRRRPTPPRLHPDGRIPRRHTAHPGRRQRSTAAQRARRGTRLYITSSAAGLLATALLAAAELGRVLRPISRYRRRGVCAPDRSAPSGSRRRRHLWGKHCGTRGFSKA
jgi:hypothetical protein